MSTVRESRKRRHPNPTPSSNDEALRTKRIMAKLKASIISRLGPSVDSSDIECRLQEVFRGGFRTPTHPPYALMITTAVLELKEENGSTEEAISVFIRQKFDDLPFAHGRILQLQLGKLCEAKEIARIEGGRYLVVEDRVEAEAKVERKQQCEELVDKKKKNKCEIACRGEKVGHSRTQSIQGCGKQWLKLQMRLPVTKVMIELPHLPLVTEDTARMSGYLNGTEENLPSGVDAAVIGEKCNDEQFGEKLQLQPTQDRVQGFVINPSLGRKDKQILEEKHLQVQIQGSHNKLESRLG